MEGWTFFHICCLLMTMVLYLCDARTIDERIRDASTSRASREGGIRRRGNKVLVELDMWISLAQWEQMINRNRRTKRKAIRNLSSRWPDGIIKYMIDSSISDAEDIGLIMSAIKAWQTYTCLRFLPAKGDEDHIMLFSGRSEGCSADVGMVSGTQTVELGKWCRHYDIILHEIGHAVGFFHEHNRPDRDDYVTIIKENIQDNEEHNFIKQDETSVNTYEVPYDYTSVMHYGSNEFSKNGLPTVIAKDPTFQSKMGKAADLSLKDVQLGNYMYSCHLCAEDEYLCRESFKCIKLSLRCDGKKDCFGGEDEVGCASSTAWTTPTRPFTPTPTSPPPTFAPTCEPSEFDCLDDGSECVESGKLCDGTEDCEAGQDELGCGSTASTTPTSPSTTTPTTSAPTCGASEFDCLGDGTECVESDFYCNGIEDCSGGQDELGCGGSCAPYQLDCTGQGIHCVNKSKLCDFNKDCPNGKDEQLYCQCGEGEYDCGNKQCVPTSARCDGRDDCSNSADERSCPAKQCEQIPCEQICQNRGSKRYKCKCRSSFGVDSGDKTKCIVRGPEPSLLLATPTYTQLVGVDSKKEAGTVHDFDGLSAVSSDSYKKRLIFVENNTIKYYVTGGSSSRRYNVLLTGLGQVEGIAYDYMNDVIFFADSQKRTIEAVNRKKRVVVVSNLLYIPMSVAVSPPTGYMFWSDHGLSSIERSHMDGSRRRVIMTNEEVYKPVSLTLDHPDKRLYWVESELNAIGSCDYSGMRISTIASPMPGGLPTSVVPYRNYLFVAGTSNSVVKVRHNRGRATRTTPTVVAQPGTTVVDMVVHHRAVQTYARRVCRTIKCRHLCVAVPNRNKVRPKCLCPAGKTLQPDRRTCG